MAQVDVSRIADDADKIVTMWDENPDFVLGAGSNKTTREEFKAKRARIAAMNKEIEATESTLSKQRDARDDAAKELRTLNTRVRSSVRGTYGPDSAEYAQTGGTRSSERKSPGRKPKTKATA